MRAMLVVLVTLAIVEGSFLFFAAGRLYERNIDEVIRSCQAAADVAEVGRRDAEVAIQGCEYANHLVLADAQEAQARAQNCDEFFESINNLGELLTP